MASANRTSSEVVKLVRALDEAPFKFDFFQAMRLIEAINPHMERIGKGSRPSDEPVRLGQEPSLAFAPSMLAEFRPGEDESAPLKLISEADSLSYVGPESEFLRSADIFRFMHFDSAMSTGEARVFKHLVDFW